MSRKPRGGRKIDALVSKAIPMTPPTAEGVPPPADDDDDDPELLIRTDPGLPPVEAPAAVVVEEASAVEEGPSAPQEEALVLPDLTELAALLAEARGVVAQVTISEQEAEDMLRSKAALTEDLQALPIRKQKKEERVSRIENAARRDTRRLSTPNNWTNADLERFTAAGLIPEGYAETYIELRDQAQQLAEVLKMSTGPGNEKIREIFDRLQPALKKIEADLSNRLNERADETSQRIATIREDIARVYKEKAERLQGEIDEINRNLGVQRVLHERNERATAQERAAREAEERAAREAAAAEEKRRTDALRRMFTEVQQAIKRLEGVHGQAWGRLTEVMGIEKLREQLLAAHEERDPKKRDPVFDKVRERLANTIRSDRSDKRLRSMQEIAPWMIKTDRRYGESMETLHSGMAKEAFEAQGGTPAQAETRNRLVREQAVFDRLYGLSPQMARARRGAKPGVVYRAFEERAATDRVEAQENAKATREAKKREAAEAKVKQEQLLAAGGFEVTDNDGKNGVVVIAEETSTKGKPVVRVVGIAGNLRGLSEGAASDPSLRSFPQWFQRAVHQHRADMRKAQLAAEAAAKVEVPAPPAPPAAEATSEVPVAPGEPAPVSVVASAEAPAPAPAEPAAPSAETSAAPAEPALSPYAQSQLTELQGELSKYDTVNDAAKTKIVADFVAAVSRKTDEDQIGDALLDALTQLDKAEQRAAAAAAAKKRRKSNG